LQKTYLYQKHQILIAGRTKRTKGVANKERKEKEEKEEQPLPLPLPS
jgi:hypothetical protein